MKRRSQPVVKSVQHTGGRPGGNTIVFLLVRMDYGRILDDGRNDSVSAVSNCTMESLSTLVVLPVDHCLRLRPERRVTFLDTLAKAKRLQRPWFDFYQQGNKTRSIFSRTGGCPMKRGLASHINQANIGSQLVGQDLHL